jgi:hypothetical protein
VNRRGRVIAVEIIAFAVHASGATATLGCIGIAKAVSILILVPVCTIPRIEIVGIPITVFVGIVIITDFGATGPDRYPKHRRVITVSPRINTSWRVVVSIAIAIRILSTGCARFKLRRSWIGRVR